MIARIKSPGKLMQSIVTTVLPFRTKLGFQVGLNKLVVVEEFAKRTDAIRMNGAKTGFEMPRLLGNLRCF